MQYSVCNNNKKCNQIFVVEKFVYCVGVAVVSGGGEGGGNGGGLPPR